MGFSPEQPEESDLLSLERQTSTAKAVSRRKYATRREWARAAEGREAAGRKYMLKWECPKQKHFLDKQQGRVVWKTHREEESESSCFGKPVCQRKCPLLPLSLFPPLPASACADEPTGSSLGGRKHVFLPKQQGFVSLCTSHSSDGD